VHDWGDFGFGMGFIGWVFMILFWALILLGIGALTKRISSTTTGTSGSSPERPLDILKKRYARGEIDRDEFEQKKRDLED